MPDKLLPFGFLNGLGQQALGSWIFFLQALPCIQLL
jgi:hypothetical protein